VITGGVTAVEKLCMKNEKSAANAELLLPFSREIFFFSSVS